MKEITELQKQILKQEFPQISFSDDLDVERYFELRKNGFLEDALYLYNRKLKQKYPDEAMRIELLSSYRKKSTRFQELLTDNLIQLADTTTFKIKQIIDLISEKIAKLNINDVYAVVQQCELIVSAISKDRFLAISFTEKYARYATILNYKKNEMRKSAEIIRMYVTDALSSVREYKEEQADIAAKKKRAVNEYKPKSVFDFSKIVFTRDQINAIVISDNIKSTEDKVIAYTLKYWNLYSNSAFENTILLYSRKYKTKHFNIFQAVKIGRYRAWKDEEILHAVLANVVDGYYYSISGDLYLQRQWNKAMASLKLEERKKLIAAAAEKEEKSKDIKVKAVKTKNAKTKKILAKEEKTKEVKSKDVKVKEEKRKTEKIKSETKKEVKKIKPKKTSALKPKIEKQIKTGDKKNIISTNANIDTINTMSIAEMVMNLTGSKYKIHKGIFFVTIRKSIRKTLNKQSFENPLAFNDTKNNAEDLIYSFFEDNYDNPFQNWLKSKQHSEIKKLGFEIDEIESIVRDWAKNERK